MKRIIVILLLTCTHMAFAQDRYFGAGFGQASVDIERANIPGVAETVEDEAESFKVFSGFRIGQNTALEIAYIDIGEFSQTLDDGVDRIGIKLDSSAIAVSLLGKFPFSKRSALYARGGLYRWSVDASIRIDGATYGSLSASGSDDGTEPLFGLGFENSLGNWGLRAEWERYLDWGGDAGDGQSDLDLISLSVFLGF